MDIESQFSATYSDARAKFLAGCERAGAALTSYQNPQTGPGGEALFTDVARLGPVDADRVLVVISGTHGVEGFCGSGVQVGLLENPAAPELPDGTALLLVHGINPHGFAWMRRVTEDNVDLNRNFVDHENRIYPDNAGYEVIADALVPKTWDVESQTAAQAVLDAYGQEHGLFALQAAISIGQYRHEKGLFYGGVAPTWSRRCVEQIADAELGGAQHAALIDFHTGLGPYGYGEMICVHAPQDAAFERAQAWYGADITSPSGGSSSSPDVKGTLAQGLFDLASQAHWTGIALEFGTKPLPDVMDSLRADAWLHNDGDLDSAQGAEIKADIRAAFYPDEKKWKEKIWARGSEIVGLAFDGLTKAS